MFKIQAGSHLLCARLFKRLFSDSLVKCEFARTRKFKKKRTGINSRLHCPPAVSVRNVAIQIVKRLRKLPYHLEFTSKSLMQTSACREKAPLLSHYCNRSLLDTNHNAETTERNSPQEGFCICVLR